MFTFTIHFTASMCNCHIHILSQ